MLRIIGTFLGFAATALGGTAWSFGVFDPYIAWVESRPHILVSAAAFVLAAILFYFFVWKKLARS